MKKHLIKYVIWTYVVFFLSIAVIGAVLTLTKSQVLFRTLQTIAAWVPTFVLMGMFRKIYLGDTWKDYVKRQFSDRIKASTVISIVLLYSGVFLASLLFTSVTQKVPVYTLVQSSWMTILGLFGINIVSGATGEEIGWRGFILTELQKRHSPLKSAVIVGVVWGFWHTLIWLVSGFTGWQLVQYIVCFLVTGIAASIITAAFYNLNRNLVIPMLTHQLLNFFLGMQTGDILHIFRVTAIAYSIAAIVLILVNYRKCLYGNTQKKPVCKSSAMAGS